MLDKKVATFDEKMVPHYLSLKIKQGPQNKGKPVLNVILIFAQKYLPLSRKMNLPT